MRRIRSGALVAALALCTVVFSGVAGAETRGYVISDFHTATYADKLSCIHGSNGTSVDIRRRVLLRMGYTTARANQLLIDEKDNAGVSVEDLLLHRGVHSSKVDPYNNPQDAVDPKIKLAGGRYAPGFDLDDDPNTGFEDPESHQRGVDNNLFRALGCFDSYHLNLPTHPMYEHVMWDTLFDTMPAWVIYVTGRTLTANGPVEVTFDRATQHPRRNTSGGALVNTTFLVETPSRSKSTFTGEIRDGFIYINNGTMSLEGESPILTKLDLHNYHARIKIESDGSLSGLIGGYQPWMDIFYMVSSAMEIQIGLDIPGIYYAFKSLADHAPDPVTGNNLEISGAYRIVAVPAFLASLNGAVFATGADGSQLVSKVAGPGLKSQ